LAKRKRFRSVERRLLDAPLNAPNPSTYFGGGAAGYNDYPCLAVRHAH